MRRWLESIIDWLTREYDAVLVDRSVALVPTPEPPSEDDIEFSKRALAMAAECPDCGRPKGSCEG